MLELCIVSLTSLLGQILCPNTTLCFVQLCSLTGLHSITLKLQQYGLPLCRSVCFRHHSSIITFGWLLLTVIQLVFVYSLQNAHALCNNIEPNTLGQEDAVFYRGVILNRLLSARQSTSCAALSCVHPTSEDVLDWIQCDGCHMWLHFACEGIARRPSSTAFRCSVCKLSPVS